MNLVTIMCLWFPALMMAMTPQPYHDVALLPEYPFGYYSNAGQIQSIFDENDIRVVIEVGSWIGGGSTRHMENC
jgi:hypothetical protein